VSAPEQLLQNTVLSVGPVSRVNASHPRTSTASENVTVRVISWPTANVPVDGEEVTETTVGAVLTACAVFELRVEATKIPAVIKALAKRFMISPKSHTKMNMTKMVLLLGL
jgi:hypothetical protein